MIRCINVVMNEVFSLLLAPFQGRGPWAGMLAVSLPASVLVLFIFRLASNQTSIRRRKDRLLARVLELALFQDDIVVNMGAFGRVLRANLAYLAALMMPLCASVLPLILILAQVNAWFGVRPLRPGESALVSVRFQKGFPLMERSVSLEGSAGVTVETDAVRIPAMNEACWRLRAKNDGSGWMARGAPWIDVEVNGRKIRKEVAVGKSPAAMSGSRLQGGFWNELKYPSESPLPSDCPLVHIKIGYPDSEFVLGGIRLNWLLVFTVLTLLFAWALKKPLGVEI